MDRTVPSVRPGPASDRGVSARPVLGAGLMFLAVGCFTSMDSVLRHLAAEHDIFYLVFLRYLIHLLIVAALAPALGARRIFRTTQPALQIARGGLLAASTAFIVLALVHLPMAQTYAISFSAPLIATALAIPLLGERPSRRDWACIATGFVGVVVALRPDPATFSLALLYPLAMATTNAGYQVLTRLGGRREDPLTLLFHVGLFGTLWTSLAVPFVYESLPAGSLAMLAGGVSLGTLGQLLLIQAFRVAPTAIVSPMGYSQIVWAAALGWAVFGEVPSAFALVGSAIIAASGIALVRGRQR